MVEATARDESIQGEWWYSSAHSRPRHYMEVNAQFHSPPPPPPRKKRSWYQLNRRLDRTPEPSMTLWKIQKTLVPITNRITVP